MEGRLLAAIQIHRKESKTQRVLHTAKKKKVRWSQSTRNYMRSMVTDTTLQDCACGQGWLLQGFTLIMTILQTSLHSLGVSLNELAKRAFQMHKALQQLHLWMPLRISTVTKLTSVRKLLVPQHLQLEMSHLVEQWIFVWRTTNSCGIFNHFLMMESLLTLSMLSKSSLFFHRFISYKMTRDCPLHILFYGDQSNSVLSDRSYNIIYHYYYENLLQQN